VSGGENRCACPHKPGAGCRRGLTSGPGRAIMRVGGWEMGKRGPKPKTDIKEQVAAALVAAIPVLTARIRIGRSTCTSTDAAS